MHMENRGLATVGPGIDSLLEYTMKGYTLLGDAALYRAYRADVSRVYRTQYVAGHFVPVVPHTGQFVLERPFSGLQMFWPLLPLLEGDLATALETYAANLEVVSFTLLQPEGYYIAPGKILYADASYPLRPEFIEATYSLYRATHDNVFLRVCSCFPCLHTRAPWMLVSHMPFSLTGTDWDAPGRTAQ